MTDFHSLLDRLGLEDSEDPLYMAAEAAWTSRLLVEATALDYGMAAVSLLPQNATPFQRGFACALAAMLMTEMN